MCNDDELGRRRRAGRARHRRAGLAAAAAPRLRRAGQGPVRPAHQPAPRRGEASAITAAELLHHFAGEVPWAHLDIAGTAWDVPRPYFDKGATGFGVRLLVEVARR